MEVAVYPAQVASAFDSKQRQVHYRLARERRDEIRHRAELHSVRGALDGSPHRRP